MTTPSASTDWLVLVAKQPIVGQSKTRLARDIGSDDAQRLAEAFALDTLDWLTHHPGTRALIAYAPDSGLAWFQNHAPTAELTRQPAGDLGDRVHSAIREAFQRGATRCVVVGMDTPHLEQQTLTAAFRALETKDVCIGPASDGGYYLIGMCAEQPRLFERVPWSTATVLAVTHERARESKLSVHELQVELDIDEGRDLAELAELLSQRPDVAPRTRLALGRIQPIR